MLRQCWILTMNEPLYRSGAPVHRMDPLRWWSGIRRWSSPGDEVRIAAEVARDHLKSELRGADTHLLVLLRSVMSARPRGKSVEQETG